MLRPVFKLPSKKGHAVKVHLMPTDTKHICDSAQRSYINSDWSSLRISSTSEKDLALWYALYVKPRFEKKVASRLQEMGFEVCVPTQTVWRQWSDRRKKIEKVIFERYVFVATNQERKHEVFLAGHIFRFVQSKGKAIALSPKEIDLIQRLSTCSEPVDISNTALTPGKEVEIIRGTLRGFRGTIISIQGKSKVQLTLPGLGFFAQVEIDVVSLQWLENIN
jgi:transcription antitermination factor NusG